jgi:hypothetical protein
MKFLSIHWKPRRDGVRVDGMPMEAQLRRQFGRCHISWNARENGSMNKNRPSASAPAHNDGRFAARKAPVKSGKFRYSTGHADSRWTIEPP